MHKVFAYMFGGKPKKVVWRVWRKMYEAGGKSAFHIPMEAVSHKIDPFHRKISGYTEYARRGSNPRLR